MIRPTGSLRRIILIAGIVGSGAALSPALADAPDARPAGMGGGWWDNPAAAPAADHRVPERDDPLRSRSGGVYNNVADFPGAQLNDWVVANALAARARALRSQAESDLQETIRRVQGRFEHSAEYIQTLAAQQQAYADYAAARQNVMVTVGNDPKYLALSQLRDQLGDKIAARRNAKDASPDDLQAMATLKLQYAFDARAIEIASLNADASLQNAKEKMVATTRKLSELRARFEYSVHENPEVALARKNLDATRINVVETAALTQGAAIASEYAVNYSYFLHRNDNGGPYGANGVYGAAYSSPYWGR